MRPDGTIQPAKITHFSQQGYKIKGLIHGGANDGEEVYSYKDLGIENILCFEPLPLAVEKFRRDHPDIDVVPMALGDENAVAEFYVTKGDGKGSSLLAPITDHPEVVKHWTDNSMVEDKIMVHVIRLDKYFNTPLKHKVEDYDCLVLDTQGNELEILKGCGKLLQNFKYISVELSSDPVYEGEHPAEEVAKFLIDNGFTQDTEIQPHNDVFFIRRDIKPTSDLIYRGLA